MLTPSIAHWPSRYFDFEKLAEVTASVTRNLNKIIDVNFYPVETARNSNMRHRPIGIGVQASILTGLSCLRGADLHSCIPAQGLADLFILLDMPFDSEEACQLNKDIFETIYYSALKTSVELAKAEGGGSREVLLEGGGGAVRWQGIRTSFEHS